MATPEETTWTIEPHTETKHRILRNYLNAWFPILNKYHKRLVYLDGFSGPGIYKGHEPGSPIIALQTAIDHFSPINGEAVFLFIEERSDRAENLRNEVSKLTLPDNYRVYIKSSKFEPTVTNILDDLEKDGRRLAPTFAFVDPFGFSGLPYNLLERLLEHERSEAYITFMVDSINRFLSHPNETINEHIRVLFGTDEVFEILSSPGDRVNALAQLYHTQLRKLGSFVRSFEMRDENDKIIYYLKFVSKHSLGHLKMKEAMWQVDSEGDFRFSDATNPAQQVLFRSEHDRTLLDKLKNTFSGTTVEISTIRKYIHDQTAYINKHMTAGLRLGEQNKEIRVEDTKKDGSKRKRNTFPDNAIVTFL